MDGLNLVPNGQAWTPWGLSTGYDLSEEIFLSSNTTPGSVAWPTANLAIYFPFYVQAPGYVQQLWWVNGATATGNGMPSPAKYQARYPPSVKTPACAT